MAVYSNGVRLVCEKAHQKHYVVGCLPEAAKSENTAPRRRRSTRLLGRERQDKVKPIRAQETLESERLMRMALHSHCQPRAYQSASHQSTLCAISEISHAL